MNTVKRIVALMVSLCIIIGITGCNNNTTESDFSSVYSDSPGGYSTNTESKYDNTVSDWKNEGTASDEFDNTSGSDVPTPTPGLSINSTSTTVNTQQQTTNTLQTDNNYTTVRTMEESTLAEQGDLQYYYEGSNYAYGVTYTGFEFIAFKDEDGKMYDILSGGGKFVLCNSSGNQLLNVGKVYQVSSTMQDSYDAVQVTYNLSGSAASGATVKTTYTFKESSISYSSQISASASEKISSSKSYLSRGFVNSYKNENIKVNGKWLYPQNGDYPYQDFESLMFENKIDDTLYCYSFMRGDDLPTNYSVTQLNSAKMPLYFDDAKGIHYTTNYDLTFVDSKAEGQDTIYRAISKSQSADFAAGVAAITDSGDNSTIFNANEVQLNLNVTNLTSEDLKFSLRYDVHDYYGNVVDAGIFIDSTVYAYVDANRTVTIKGKYGMYYLNLYVISKYSTYIECYPFALLEPYEFKYQETNPFGLATLTHTDGDDQVGVNAANLCVNKLGAGNYRIGRINSATETLIANGITAINGAFNPVNYEAADMDSYVSSVFAALEPILPYIDSYEVGNEMSLQAHRVNSEWYGKFDELYARFYKYTYTPSWNALKKTYPNLKYIPTPFSACEQTWIDQFTEGFGEDEDGDGEIDTFYPGIWDKLEIVSTHIYGNPWMPDQYGQYQPEWTAGMWSIEAAMQRMADCFEKYRYLREDGTDPEFYLTEVGYPTIPESSAAVCLRTQADYTARIGAICASYGADRIQYYCLTDRTSYGSGFDNTYMEYGFGLIYQQDIYGVLKPKPAAITFAVMNRNLESVKENGASIFDKYDEGWDVGGVRAFKFDTQLYGTVVAAYSNKQVLPNGKKNAVGGTGDRTPTLPWNTLWTETDPTEFEATGDTVKVVDSMGNATEYKAVDGKVTIPLTGEMVYIYGVK